MLMLNCTSLLSLNILGKPFARYTERNFIENKVESINSILLDVMKTYKLYLDQLAQDP